MTYHHSAFSTHNGGTHSSRMVFGRPVPSGQVVRFLGDSGQLCDHRRSHVVAWHVVRLRPVHPGVRTSNLPVVLRIVLQGVA